MPRLSAQIASTLEVEILSGSLPSGSRLPSEEKLSERFAASRTVIREAIQQLRGRGLLISRKGSGTFIADPSLENLGTAFEAYSVLADTPDFLELIDFRILIESECARLAAPHAGERHLQRMRQAIDRMEQARGNQALFSRADIAFHVAIADASRNKLYAAMLGALEKTCIDFAQTNRAESDWYGEVIEQHRGILAAIETGRPDQAADAMRRHLLSSRRHFVDLTTEPKASTPG
ncbi:GntR family transcriptional repressor for pyruvate dehydrogenase complex [Haloferula luteola]|uniref:GntR family transcriptional repressor for pyruvate dehydrogenase complex n=1 Tax=Haloferula luteola TaxID=595692 RepID=A0A840UYI6_9BACT|nr:FadR/GntR family transcriptional regulator [Haloferula luteola]MBB5350063.1 GntR family transcriptional repressor for pyruvate dehydrogenase complex [Haloferula luteola]